MVGDILIHNPTDREITIWWGHTPYPIPANSTEEVPGVLKECLSHKDYQELRVVDSKNAIVEEPKSTETYPWDDPAWDVDSASEEDLKKFASVYGLIWDDENRDNMIETIYEKLMEIRG